LEPTQAIGSGKWRGGRNAPVAVPERAVQVTLVTRIKSADPEDWARTPNDVPALLELLRKEAGVPFASDAKSIDEIAPDAAARPVLYRSGFKSFKLTESEVAKLRE
jgi:hypothetical protein